MNDYRAADPAPVEVRKAVRAEMHHGGVAASLSGIGEVFRDELHRGPRNGWGSSPPQEASDGTFRDAQEPAVRPWVRHPLSTPPPYGDLVAVLSDADILRRVEQGELRIDPFADTQLTPNGYDVTVEEIALPTEDLRIREGTARVPPLTRFAIGTREVVELGPRLCGQIWLRTTWARRGVVASFGMIDAGFSGSLTFGAFNASGAPLEVAVGERFAQVIFSALESPASATYERRSGAYQGQRGVTLDRP